MSIAENIAYGDVGKDVNQEEIEKAAKEADIFDFISALPKVILINEKGRDKRPKNRCRLFPLLARVSIIINVSEIFKR